VGTPTLSPTAATATEIAAGQGDLSDREFIKVLQDSIKETQRALDLALKDMQPSLNRSPKRMLELLKRPTHNYEAATCAENHRQLLRAAALALNQTTTTTPTEDIQTLHPASGPIKKTKSVNRPATTTKSPAGQKPPTAGKKRGRTSSTPSTDSAGPPKAKKRKMAAAPTKRKHKS
jgi:hypothetical protein